MLHNKKKYITYENILHIKYIYNIYVRVSLSSLNCNYSFIQTEVIPES